jgi:hypothetical protein
VPNQLRYSLITRIKLKVSPTSLRAQSSSALRVYWQQLVYSADSMHFRHTEPIPGHEQPGGTLRVAWYTLQSNSLFL